MILSRLWLTLLTVVAAGGLALAVLLPRLGARELDREAGARLERAQHGASLLLKVNARKWMDTAAQVATDAVLVEALDQATRGPADLALIHKTVQERLKYFNERMRVDLVTATDGKGRVIARAGLDEGEYKDGMEGLPLVADALRGLRGDDTWSLGGRLYRVAASPVIARDRYVGSLIVGQEVNAELAQSMKQVLDVEIAFLLRGKVLAATSPLPVLSQLPDLLGQQQEALLQAGHGPVAPLEADGQRFAVLGAPFVGEAAGHQAAYVLLSARPAALDPMTALLRVPWRELGELPPPLLGWLAGGLGFLLVLGWVLVRYEADRPVRALTRQAQALARGEQGRIDDQQVPARLAPLARALNALAERSSGPTNAAVSRAAQPEPRVEPTPEPRSRSDATADLPPAPAAHPLRADPTQPPEHRPTAAAPTPRTGPQLEVAEGTELRETLVDRQEPNRGPQARIDTENTPLPTPLPFGEQQHRPPDDEVRETVEAPALLFSPTPAPAPRGSPAPHAAAAGGTLVAGDDEEDEPTRTVPLPDRQVHPSDPSLSPPTQGSHEGELGQIFQEFVDTKQRLGESLEGVTYERFATKLRQNRTQLMARFGCRDVKFQVYVKDGRAALKATPIHG